MGTRSADLKPHVPAQRLASLEPPPSPQERHSRALGVARRAGVAAVSLGGATLAVLALVGLVSLVVWEWFRDDPIVDVHLFRNLNFLSANAMMFMAGIMMFSSAVNSNIRK